MLTRRRFLSRTGDHHACIAGDVRAADGRTVPAAELARRRAADPWYSELDDLHHGHVVREASKPAFTATFRKLRSVRRRSSALASSRTYTVEHGHAGL